MICLYVCTFVLHFRLNCLSRCSSISALSRNLLYTGAAQRDVHLTSLRARDSAFVSVKDISHRPDMSRLKHVSFEKKKDGRSGFKVIYDGKQLLSLASKRDAEDFITKHLRSIGKIGKNDPPPLKAKCRPRVKPKSKKYVESYGDHSRASTREVTTA